MSKTRNPRLDIPEELLRSLYIDQMMSGLELARMFHMNTSNLKATLAHYGIPQRKRGPRSPEHHGSWNGGKTIDKDGYMLIHSPDHPDANSSGYVREHRLVMEKIIGRPLDPKEVVHHKNGVKVDNRPDNLELFAKNGDHLRHELTGHCPEWTEDGKRKLAESAAKIRKTIPPEADLEGMYREQGISAKEIGKMFGCSEARVLKEFRSRGVRIKTNSESHSSMKLPSDAELKQMLSNQSTPEVAARCGVKIGSFYDYLQRRGIPTSRKQGVKRTPLLPASSPIAPESKQPDAP